MTHDEPLLSGSGVEISERQRLEDLTARAATIGFSVRPLPSGFVLRRDRRLVHFMGIEAVAEFLGTEEGRGP